MPEPKYMEGTTGTTYLQIGQIGNVGMGVRLYPLNCINPAGLKNQTYFVVRVRIAYVDPVTEDDEGTVINLGAKKTLTLDDAWKDMPREKKDSTRHSSFFGFYLDADVSEDPKAFLEELYDGKFRAFCQELVKLVGENAIVETSDIQAFLAQTLDPGMANMLKVHETQESLKEHANVPGFHVAGITSALMSEQEDNDTEINPIKGALGNVQTMQPASSDVDEDPMDAVDAEEKAFMAELEGEAGDSSES